MAKRLPETLAKDWATHDEACRLLAKSRTTLYELRRAGVLVDDRYNGSVIVSRKSIDQFLEKWEEGAGS